MGTRLPFFYRKSLVLSESPSQILSSSLFWRENGFRASWRRMCVILKSLWLVYLTCCLSITRLWIHSPVFSGKTVLNSRTAASHCFKGANAVHAVFTVLSSFCELTWSTFVSSWPGKLSTCPGIHNSMLMLNYVWILFDRTEESRIHKGLVRKHHFISGISICCFQT